MVIDLTDLREELRAIAKDIPDEDLETTQRGVVAVLDLGRRWAAGDPLDLPLLTGNLLLDTASEQRAAAESVAAKAEALERAHKVLDVLARYAKRTGEVAGRIALEAVKEQFGG